MPESPALAALLAGMASPSLPGISPGLERMEALLDHLDNPERKLPPVVHVAGTNGKGSLIAYLRAALEAAGLKVHVYSSPHLVHFRERIRVAGKLISDEALMPLLMRVQAEMEITPVTFFEATTAAAFLAFAESSADILLLETGMGGRLDATNLIPKPVLTALTPISLDHREFLGDTVEAIAFEKAGILKKDVPCISAAQSGRAGQVIRTQALETKAPLQMGGEDWAWWVDGERLHLRIEGVKKAYDFPKPNLAGTHQWPNAMLAAVCLLELTKHFPITKKHIAIGLTHASWPGRLQKLSRLHPLAQALPLGSSAWLDGGHNASAAQALADWLHTQTEAAGSKFWLIWGMLANKDAKAFLAPLLPYLQGVVVLPILSEMPCHRPEGLQAIVRESGLECLRATDPLDAANVLDAKFSEGFPVLIAGSLYLAGEVLGLEEGSVR